MNIVSSSRSTFHWQTYTQPRPQWNRKLMIYYTALLLVTLGGLAYGFVFSEVFFPSQTQSDFNTVLNWLKLSWLIPLPYALLNFLLVFPLSGAAPSDCARRDPQTARAALLPLCDAGQP